MKSALQWITVVSLLLTAGAKSVSIFSENGVPSIDPVTGLHGLFQTPIAVAIELISVFFLLSPLSIQKKGALLTSLAAVYAVYHLVGLSLGQGFHCNCLGESLVSQAIKIRVVATLIAAYFFTGIVFMLSQSGVQKE